MSLYGHLDTTLTVEDLEAEEHIATQERHANRKMQNKSQHWLHAANKDEHKLK